MDRLAVLKIAFALAGVGIFGYGVQSRGRGGAMGAALHCVVAAFLLRFVKKRPVE